ncbi:MAG: hypothetical protein V7634_2846 [Bradyrhizobium sp.]
MLNREAAACCMRACAAMTTELPQHLAGHDGVSVRNDPVRSHAEGMLPGRYVHRSPASRVVTIARYVLLPKQDGDNKSQFLKSGSLTFSRKDPTTVIGLSQACKNSFLARADEGLFGLLRGGAER